MSKFRNDIIGLGKIALEQTNKHVPNKGPKAIVVTLGMAMGFLLYGLIQTTDEPAQQNHATHTPLQNRLPEKPAPQTPAVTLPERPIVPEPARETNAGVPVPEERPSILGAEKAYERDQLTKVLPKPRPSNLDLAMAKAFPRTRPDFAKPLKSARGKSVVTKTKRPMTVDMPPLRTARLGTCGNTLTASIPPRAKHARDIRTILADVENLEGTERDRKLEKEVLMGNIPDFLRKLVPVQISGKTRDGRNTEIVLCVTPDYIAAGSNSEFVRLPFGLKSAMRIADRFNMELPTTRMVDHIFATAELHLAPSPMKPGDSMRTTNYFRIHNDKVEKQRRQAGAKDGMLIAGQKKDIVLTERLFNQQGRVAIYGWHRSNGRPIQPLSTVHGASYADYSHGLRLVSKTAYLNGQALPLRQLMSDPMYARFLHDEGPFREEVLASLDGLKRN